MNEQSGKQKLTESDKRWVDALRSGKHNQGNTYLCKIIDDSKYECCLGVRLNIDEFVGNLSGCAMEFNGRNSDLPIEYAKDKGFFSAVGCFKGKFKINCRNRHFYSLSSLNDNGFPFLQIADLIEELPWLVFRHYDEPDVGQHGPHKLPKSLTDVGCELVSE